MYNRALYLLIPLMLLLAISVVLAQQRGMLIMQVLFCKM